MSISNQCPGDADIAGLGTMRENRHIAPGLSDDTGSCLLGLRREGSGKAALDRRISWPGGESYRGSCRGHSR